MRKVYVKKLGIFVLVVFLAFLFPLSLSAKVQGSPLKSYEGPFLLTSGGQGPGSKMLRLLLVNSGNFKLGTDFYLEDEPSPRLEELKSGKYKTLVIVIGVTDKGLGASGITLRDELNNLKELVDIASSMDIPIIAIYLENYRNQIDELYTSTDMVIDLVCPYAQWLICKKDISSRGRFISIANENKIPLSKVDSVQELVKVWPSIFPL